MNTAVINFTTEPKLKEQAQKVAKNLGIPLSLALNNYLKHLIKTKTVVFSEENPSKYLRDAIKQAEIDLKKGNTSPVFTNIEDNLKWLEEQGI